MGPRPLRGCRRIRDSLANQYRDDPGRHAVRRSPRRSCAQIRDNLANQYGGIAGGRRRRSSTGGAPRDPRQPRRPVRRTATGTLGGERGRPAVGSGLNVRVMAHTVTVDIAQTTGSAARREAAARVRRHLVRRAGHRHRVRPSTRACAVRDRRHVGRRGARRGRPRRSPAPRGSVVTDVITVVADRPSASCAGLASSRAGPARGCRCGSRRPSAVPGAPTRIGSRLPAVHALQPQRQRRRRSARTTSARYVQDLRDDKNGSLGVLVRDGRSGTVHGRPRRPADLRHRDHAGGQLRERYVRPGHRYRLPRPGRTPSDGHGGAARRATRSPRSTASASTWRAPAGQALHADTAAC